MKNQSDNSYSKWLFLALPVLWIGAGLASGYEDGMTAFEVLGKFSEWADHPFLLRWTPYTLKFMLGALVVYAFAVVLYISGKQNRRPGEEHGSARWGNPRQLDRKYRDKDPKRNAILTQNLRMSLNSRQHFRNLLQIVVGGSGAGKTRYIVKPSASVRAERRVSPVLEAAPPRPLRKRSMARWCLPHTFTRPTHRI